MTLEVHALEADGSLRHARFESVEGFRRQDAAGDGEHALRAVAVCDQEPARLARRAHVDAAGVAQLEDETLYRVRAVLVDHEMPVMAYAIEEKAQVRVAVDRILAMGLATGAWLRTLKQAVLAGAPDDTVIDLAWVDARGAHASRATVGELRPLVLDTVPGRRIGYVTDLRFTEDNVERLQALLADVDLLHIECVFAQAECGHALRENHLTAPQAGAIAQRLRAKRVVPFHFSPRYRGREQDLRDELDAAWAAPRAERPSRSHARRSRRATP
jgi:ribonuclease Z